MSKDEDKIKHSKRLHKAWTAIKKQLRIAKSHGLTKPIEEPQIGRASCRERVSSPV